MTRPTTPIVPDSRGDERWRTGDQDEPGKDAVRSEFDEELEDEDDDWSEDEEDEDADPPEQGRE